MMLFPEKLLIWFVQFKKTASGGIKKSKSQTKNAGNRRISTSTCGLKKSVSKNSSYKKSYEQSKKNRFLFAKKMKLTKLQNPWYFKCYFDARNVARKKHTRKKYRKTDKKTLASWNSLGFGTHSHKRVSSQEADNGVSCTWSIVASNHKIHYRY